MQNHVKLLDFSLSILERKVLMTVLAAFIVSKLFPMK